VSPGGALALREVSQWRCQRVLWAHARVGVSGVRAVARAPANMSTKLGSFMSRIKKDKDKEGEKEKEKEKEKDKEKEKKKGKDKEREKEKEKDKDKPREREREGKRGDGDDEVLSPSGASNWKDKLNARLKKFNKKDKEEREDGDASIVDPTMRPRA
jgi:hypothetical protein